MKFTQAQINDASLEDLKTLNRVYNRVLNWFGPTNKDLVEKGIVRNYRAGIRDEDTLYSITVRTVIHASA